MAKITTPDKVPGEIHYATEYNAMKASINALYDLLAGGTAGQVLTKVTNTDYDVAWQSGGGGSGTYTATVYHSATDPFVDMSTAPTTGATSLRSVTPVSGAAIEIQLNDFPFEYFVLEYDDTEADVTAFFDTVFHNEAIPGFEMRGPFAVGGKKYVTSFAPASFDASSATVSFSF